MPVMVLVGHSTDMTSWLIRWFTGSSYNHVMWLYRTGFCASQDLTYQSKDIKKYMHVASRLKFWAVELLPIQRRKLYLKIQRRLALPWYKRRYDFLGVLGQILGLRVINNPWVDYCSESVCNDLKEVMSGCPVKPSPQDLNEFAEKHPESFTYLGHWLGD